MSVPPESTVAAVRRLGGATLSSGDEELLELLRVAYPMAVCPRN